MSEDKVILAVEDDPDDMKLMVRALEKNKIRNKVVWARDGVEALDYMFAAGAHAGRDVRQLPAVVLLDLHLPRVDGLEVLRRLRADERTKLQPVVILTSSNADPDRLKSYLLGANSYVRKPVDFGRFAEAVRQLGLYWVLINEQPPVVQSAGS